MSIFRQSHGHWIPPGSGVWRLVLGCLMLTGVAAAQHTASPVGSGLAPGTFRLKVTDSALSLEANAASLAAICKAISQKTGIEIVLHRGADRTLTTQLSHVPLREAFKRLAPNVVMVDAQGPSGPSHRIAKVYILQTGQARVPQPGAEKAAVPVIPTSQEKRVPQAGARPTPFTFTFDPSQHEKPSQ